MFFSKGQLPGKLIGFNDNRNCPKTSSTSTSAPTDCEYVSYIVDKI